MLSLVVSKRTVGELSHTLVVTKLRCLRWTKVACCCCTLVSSSFEFLINQSKEYKLGPTRLQQSQLALFSQRSLTYRCSECKLWSDPNPKSNHQPIINSPNKDYMDNYFWSELFYLIFLKITKNIKILKIQICLNCKVDYLTKLQKIEQKNK